MKLLLFILGLTLCTAVPAFKSLENNDASDEEAGDYKAPKWLLENAEETLPQQLEDDQNVEETFPGDDGEDLFAEIRQDQELSLIFDYGAAGVIASGIKKNKIPNKNFTATHISAYSSVISGNQERHEFSADAVSDDKASAIKMNFTVSYNLNTHNMTLLAYSYIVKTIIPKPADSYVLLTPAEIESEGEARDMLYYGVSQVISKGIQQNKIPGSNYNITKVVSALRLIQKNKNLYKFDVQFEDANNVHVNTQFTVMLKPATREKFLMSYAYQASGIKFSIDESAYVEVNETEIKNNTELNNCLDLAIEEAIKQSEEYSISEINAVYTQVRNGIVYYKFDVELTNHNDKTVKLIATVAYDPKNGLKDVKAYESKTITTTPRK